MVVYDLFRIVHAAVTYLDGVSMSNILLSLWSLGKHLLTKGMTSWPMFELTFVLNGELYQRISFLCLFFQSFVFLSRFIIGKCIDNRSRLVLSGTGLRLGQKRLCRIDERFKRRLLTPAGMFL